MRELPYDRVAAVAYARRWALRRNPAYYNFNRIGGDCTNFASQCIYAGAEVMNYTPELGWYYRSADDRTASWTGVEFLYQFLIQNKKEGPRGKEVEVEELKIGDIIQLSFDGVIFGHAVIVTQINGNQIYVASHTIDSKNRDLNTYTYKKKRCLHIE